MGYINSAWEKIITHNGWCYEQVCLRQTFNLAQMLLANLLIARVICRADLTNKL
jgi:hypothetical protein